jgi:lipid II:glycine glycyltransferase (peptidoglycan interpeptide bridge formation enzyme)
LSDVSDFYQVFHDFAEQKGFMVRNCQYQEALWREYISRGKGRLFLSIYNGKIIGGEICLLFGRKCLEMHRGVHYKFHKMRINEALVWEGIRWAKANGCFWYSLRGAGLTQSHDSFKQKFGSELVSLAGYYDFVFLSFFYRIFYFIEFSILPKAWRLISNAIKIYHSIRTMLRGDTSNK